MAVSSAIKTARRASLGSPLWLWPNLISLDAPLVAALWQHLFAHDVNLRLCWASRAALPLTVWLVYLVDRLLDTAKDKITPATARHRFCHEHRRLYVSLCSLIVLTLTGIVFYLPRPVVLNGLWVLGAVIAYLVLIHVLPSPAQLPRIPKEFMVGILFGVGTAIAPFTRSPNHLTIIASASFFSLLCWLNTAAIEVWEGGRVDRASGWLVDHLKAVSIVICAICGLLVLLQIGHLSTMAVMLSALGYWSLADVQSQLGSDGMRVGVDLPLLSPLVLLGIR